MGNNLPLPCCKPIAVILDPTLSEEAIPGPIKVHTYPPILVNDNNIEKKMEDLIEVVAKKIKPKSHIKKKSILKGNSENAKEKLKKFIYYFNSYSSLFINRAMAFEISWLALNSLVKKSNKEKIETKINKYLNDLINFKFKSNSPFKFECMTETSLLVSWIKKLRFTIEECHPEVKDYFLIGWNLRLDILKRDGKDFENNINNLDLPDQDTLWFDRGDRMQRALAIHNFFSEILKF